MLRPRHHRQGNLIVTAIFIAVFLFFLSVALVTTNRQHIQMILNLDHRLSAQMAARAGLRLAMAKLERGEGPGSLAGTTSPADFSASFRLGWTGWPGSTTNRPKYLLTSSGISGFVVQELKVVMDEVFLSASPDTWLFAFEQSDTNPKLYACCPDFQWRVLGQLCPGGRPETLTGGDGPIRVCQRDAGADPPIVQDWPVITDGWGIFVPGAFGPTGHVIPRGDAVLELRFDKEIGEWKTLDDPNVMLGRLRQPTIDGRENGTPRLEVFITLAGPVTVDVSEYKGPVLEWYKVEGKPMACDDGALYVHATHYVFSGVHFQNKPDVVNGALVNHGTLEPARFLEDQAILKLKDKEWTVAWDTITIQDPLSPPVLSPPPRASLDCLAVAKGACYVLHKDDPNKILLATDKRLSEFAHNPSGKPALFGYKGQLRPLENAGRPDEPPAWQPQGVPLQQKMPVRSPELLSTSTNLQNGAPEKLKLRPEMRYNYTVAGTPRSVAVCGEDLYAVVNITSTAYQDGRPDPEAEPKRLTSLMRWDGQQWDVFPAGLRPLLEGRLANPYQIRLADDQTATLNPDLIVTGRYPKKFARHPRYVPLVVLP